MTSDKKTYSSDQAKRMVDEYIEESAKRLQQRLQGEWKKQKTHLQKENGYVAHSI